MVFLLNLGRRVLFIGQRPPNQEREMKPAEELQRENEALRERMSRLSQACLRINQSLDFNTVLNGILDSARSLTEARYGVMTLHDEAGRPQDFLSSGMTAEEARQLWDLPDGPLFFEYLGRIEEPLRLADLLGHIRSMGLPEFRPPVKMGPTFSFLAAPVLYRGEQAGNIYLAEKETGEEFTREDEETLILFASHAAMVMANARRYRDEQRARTDLETLINTSPVGVVVLDARTGVPVLFNREARRMVDGLGKPDQSVEELIRVLTLRRGDGREVSLDEGTLAQVLSAGETVRVEEIVLQVPDGRSVTTLVNATPIRSEEGQVESVVVTLQDMTPVQELERLRADFLAMVSHELRAPLTSIKGAAATVLGDTSVLRAAEMVLQFFRIINQQADHMSGLINDLLDVARIETGTLLVHPEPTSVAGLVDQARSTFLNSGGAGNMRIELPPELPSVMADRMRIVQVLGNLLSNAARHSPETAPILVSAVRKETHVAISVTDRGRGVSPEQLPHLFRKFPRLAGEDREGGEGGTGLGLSICKGIVEAHGGRIWAESDGTGRGTRFTFTLPTFEEGTTVALAESVPTSPRRRQSGKKTRILAVDDDPETLRRVRDALSKAGYAAIVTGDPEEVPRLMEEHLPHLVLLDLVLPGVDGIDLMQDIFEMATVPVLFLSAYGQEEVIARAFDRGATDYVLKPFSPTELAARIRAALRRRAAPGQAEPTEPCVLGELTIDYGKRRVTLAGRRVRLANIEYRLLVELSVHLGTPVTYEVLLHRVWGLENSSDLRSLRSTINSIRRKLGDNAKKPEYLFNESRVGYRLGKAE